MYVCNNTFPIHYVQSFAVIFTSSLISSFLTCTCECELYPAFRFTPVSSCRIRTWKPEWRWSSSVCPKTPNANTAPNGARRPTPSTPSGTRSLSSSRRSDPTALLSFMTQACLSWRLCDVEQVLLPEMAHLRLVVQEEGGKFLGHRIIPLDALQTGETSSCVTRSTKPVLRSNRQQYTVWSKWSIFLLCQKSLGY